MLVRVATLFAVVLLIAADEPAKDTKKEMDALQGEWSIISMEVSGDKVPDQLVKGQRLTIKENKWISVNDNPVLFKKDVTFKIDPSKNPKTIDLSYKSDGKDTTIRGIYKLEGDTLTVCTIGFGDGRPKEFKTTAEGGILDVWKREKK